jgi:hypothetical protein
MSFPWLTPTTTSGRVPVAPTSARTSASTDALDVTLSRDLGIKCNTIVRNAIGDIGYKYQLIKGQAVVDKAFGHLWTSQDRTHIESSLKGDISVDQYGSIAVYTGVEESKGKKYSTFMRVKAGQDGKWAVQQVGYFDREYDENTPFGQRYPGKSGAPDSHELVSQLEKLGLPNVESIIEKGRNKLEQADKLAQLKYPNNGAGFYPEINQENWIQL